MTLLELFEEYQRIPANAFSRPILYRLTDSTSPARELDGGLRSRSYPPPAIENITREIMKVYITWHANLFCRNRTPFISATWDLLRVFNIAGQRVLEGKEQVAILLMTLGGYRPGHTLTVIPCASKAVFKPNENMRPRCSSGRKYQQNPY